jgi:hypothetical protein
MNTRADLLALRIKGLGLAANDSLHTYRSLVVERDNEIRRLWRLVGRTKQRPDGMTHRAVALMLGVVSESNVRRIVERGGRGG